MVFGQEEVQTALALQELAKQSPGSWGSVFWQTGNVIGLRYEKPKAEDFVTVQQLLKAVPCPSCREHIHKVLAETKTKDYEGQTFGVLRYMYDVHNAVNKKLHKPELSYEECLQATAEQLHDTLEESGERNVGRKRLVLFGVGLAAGAAWYLSSRQKRARA